MANFFDIKARKAAAAAAGSSKTPTTKADENKKLQPWVEKYRPRTLDDVAAQDHTTTVLRRTLQSANLPHLLFYGPPGTGKTSTILALAHQLFGPLLIKTRVLELNASDERGISIVRQKVKDFARQQLSNPPAGPQGEEYRQRYPCPPYKIVVLDEADSMTQDAQSALRRTMETYSRLTRFCLVCNYVSRIIDPVASRCSKFRFKSLDQGSAQTRLEDIAKLEHVRYESGVIDALIRCSEGDLRRAITFLQSAARLAGAMQESKQEGKEADSMDIDVPEAGNESQVTIATVEEIAGVIPDTDIARLTEAIKSSKGGKGSAYDRIAAVIEDMVADGWSATQVVGQLYDVVVTDDTVPDQQKNQIVIVFSEIDKRLVDGADEHLEMLDLALRISEILGQR